MPARPVAIAPLRANPSAQGILMVCYVVYGGLALAVVLGALVRALAVGLAP